MLFPNSFLRFFFLLLAYLIIQVRATIGDKKQSSNISKPSLDIQCSTQHLVCFVISIALDGTPIISTFDVLSQSITQILPTNQHALPRSVQVFDSPQNVHLLLESEDSSIVSHFTFDSEDKHYSSPPPHSFSSLHIQHSNNNNPPNPPTKKRRKLKFDERDSGPPKEHPKKNSISENSSSNNNHCKSNNNFNNNNNNKFNSNAPHHKTFQQQIKNSIFVRRSANHITIAAFDLPRLTQPPKKQNFFEMIKTIEFQRLHYPKNAEITATISSNILPIAFILDSYHRISTIPIFSSKTPDIYSETFDNQLPYEIEFKQSPLLLSQQPTSSNSNSNSNSFTPISSAFSLVKGYIDNINSRLILVYKLKTESGKSADTTMNHLLIDSLEFSCNQIFRLTRQFPATPVSPFNQSISRVDVNEVEGFATYVFSDGSVWVHDFQLFSTFIDANHASSNQIYLRQVLLPEQGITSEIEQRKHSLYLSKPFVIRKSSGSLSIIALIHVRTTDTNNDTSSRLQAEPPCISLKWLDNSYYEQQLFFHGINNNNNNNEITRETNEPNQGITIADENQESHKNHILIDRVTKTTTANNASKKQSPSRRSTLILQREYTLKGFRMFFSWVDPKQFAYWVIIVVAAGIVYQNRQNLMRFAGNAQNTNPNSSGSSNDDSSNKPAEYIPLQYQPPTCGATSTAASRPSQQSNLGNLSGIRSVTAALQRRRMMVNEESHRRVVNGIIGRNEETVQKTKEDQQQSMNLNNNYAQHAMNNRSALSDNNISIPKQSSQEQVISEEYIGPYFSRVQRMQLNATSTPPQLQYSFIRNNNSTPSQQQQVHHIPRIEEQTRLTTMNGIQRRETMVSSFSTGSFGQTPLYPPAFRRSEEKCLESVESSNPAINRKRKFAEIDEKELKENTTGVCSTQNEVSDGNKSLSTTNSPEILLQSEIQQQKFFQTFREQLETPPLSMLGQPRKKKECQRSNSNSNKPSPPNLQPRSEYVENSFSAANHELLLLGKESVAAANEDNKNYFHFDLFMDFSDSDDRASNKARRKRRRPDQQQEFTHSTTSSPVAESVVVSEEDSLSASSSVASKWKCYESVKERLSRIQNEVQDSFDIRNFGVINDMLFEESKANCIPDGPNPTCSNTITLDQGTENLRNQGQNFGLNTAKLNDPATTNSLSTSNFHHFNSQKSNNY